MIQSITYLEGVSSEKDQLESFLKEWQSNNLSIQLKTSGSTGKPKIIELLKSQMRLSAKATLDYFSIAKKGNALLCLSLNTVGGIMMVVRAIENDMHLIVAPVQSEPITNLSNSISIDLCAMVPTQLNQVLLHRSEVLHQIKTLLIGGAPIFGSIVDLLKKAKHTVYQTFGMTETISHVAVRRIGLITDEYYEALPSVHFSERNNNLIIHYPRLLPDPLETKEHVELVDRFHFKWLGRTDLVVNSGGKKIYPESIEEKLDHLIPFPFLTTGIPDEHWGEMLVLIVETDSPFQLKKEELKHLGLAGHELPKRIYIIEDIDRLPGGKIDRITTLKKLNRDEYSELL